eukprot:3299798-Pyramimonas_sp.AAC.1
MDVCEVLTCSRLFGVTTDGEANPPGPSELVLHATPAHGVAAPGGDPQPPRVRGGLRAGAAAGAGWDSLRATAGARGGPLPRGGGAREGAGTGAVPPG